VEDGKGGVSPGFWSDLESEARERKVVRSIESVEDRKPQGASEGEIRGRQKLDLKTATDESVAEKEKRSLI